MILPALFFLGCSALLWFNPFVQYVGKKLSLECEIACDQSVVEQTGNASRYAMLLFEVAQSAAGEGPQFAASHLIHTSTLAVRIHHLVTHRTIQHRVLPWPAIVALMVALLSSVGVAAFYAPAFGEAKIEAAVRFRPTSSNAAAQNQRAMDSSQRVHDFPVCNVHEGVGSEKVAGMRNDATGEDPTMHVTAPTTRVKKGTLSP